MAIKDTYEDYVIFLPLNSLIIAYKTSFQTLKSLFGTAAAMYTLQIATLVLFPILGRGTLLALVPNIND